jgi:predicted phage tail protein
LHLIKVIPHGVYADLYPSLEIGASTAAEAIEGWSRQVGIKLSDERIAEVVGFDSDEKLMAPTEVTELHVVPALIGGGGGFGKILVGTLMIVGSIFLIPISPALGMALMTAGISMVIGGVMQLFMKSPSLSKEDDPDASKYIGSGRMTTAIGTLIPIGGGRMLIGGQYLSLQVNSNELVIGQFPATP